MDKENKNIKNLTKYGFEIEVENILAIQKIKLISKNGLVKIAYGNEIEEAIISSLADMVDTLENWLITNEKRYSEKVKNEKNN